MQWVGENGWSEPIFIWVTLLFSWVRWQGRGMVENMGKYNSQRQKKWVQLRIEATQMASRVWQDS